MFGVNVFVRIIVFAVFAAFGWIVGGFLGALFGIALDAAIVHSASGGWVYYAGFVGGVVGFAGGPMWLGSHWGSDRTT